MGIESESINWIEKTADWAWILLLAFGAAMMRGFRRQANHEARLKALEDHHVERTKKLSDIERKIDTNAHITIGMVEKLGNELRADNRLILSKLLDKVPSP